MESFRARVVFGLALALQVDPSIAMNPRSSLRTFEVGQGGTPVVLLHGYGSSPRDWLPYAPVIQVSPQHQFIFPEAPQQTTPPDGPLSGRAWWRLELASYRRGNELPDMSNAHPAGLDDASRAVRTLLTELPHRLHSDPRDTILGGFSQGGMIAADIARGLPVFISHGRSDDVLQFQIAERLATKMREAGMRVTWYPFNSGHEMPADAVTAMNGFLKELAVN